MGFAATAISTTTTTAAAGEAPDGGADGAPCVLAQLEVPQQASRVDAARVGARRFVEAAQEVSPEPIAEFALAGCHIARELVVAAALMADGAVAHENEPVLLHRCLPRELLGGHETNLGLDPYKGGRRSSGTVVFVLHEQVL